MLGFACKQPLEKHTRAQKKKKKKNPENIFKVTSNTLMCRHIHVQVSACSAAGGVLLTPGERRRESG